MAALKEFMEVQYHQFCNIKDITGLANLLGISQLRLSQLKVQKPYYYFEIKKQDGKSRLIEAPQKELMLVLHKLNGFLQSCYFFNRTMSAYGFVQLPRNANKKRNILTNAKIHCGKKYLLNLDLEDFFHQVSKMRVAKIFKYAPFNFSMELSGFLAELTTYKNRLPMGSPASPALTNFCTREMDIALEQLAKENHLVYTRYVDDLSFSSQQPITSGIFYEIQQVLENNSFRMNMKKMNWMGENDVKMVTGLELKERPHVTALFLEDLEINIKKFKHVIEFSTLTNGGASLDSVNRFKQHLLGKLRFLIMIYGSENPIYKKMHALYLDAFNARPFVESFNWKSFPYF
jgi:hypothetical protein